MDGSVHRGEVWASRRSGIQFCVASVARHAQDCSQSMIVYVNLQPTEDAPAGTCWVLDETIFVKRMELVEHV